jgi:hydrogenase maturation protease
MTDVVVIGYGNDLRCDDGAGRRVADAVASAGLPGVDVRSVHQLAPEHAADITGCRRVVFVDAAVGDGMGDDGAVGLRTVQVVDADRRLSHHVDPALLLALAATLGDPPGDAFIVSVPVHNLGVGTCLSPATTTAVGEAVHRVLELCRLRP